MDKCYGEPSPVQGTAIFGAWEFTSAFDSGNALSTSWSCNGKPAYLCGKGSAADERAAKSRTSKEVETISVHVARDCHGEPKFQNPQAFWFHFGITPPPFMVDAEVCIVVAGIQQQRDLYAKCYRPWVSEPSRPRWQRVEGNVEANASQSMKGWEVSWRHRFDGKHAMTRFAFCVPYSYSELQEWLGRLECTFASSAPPVPPKELSRAKADFLQRFELYPPGEAFPDLDSSPSSATSEEDDDAVGDDVYYFASRDWHDRVSRAGRGIYFHRQAVAFTPRGRRVEMLTITESSGSHGKEELPEQVTEAMRERRPETEPGALALHFPGRPVVFFSGRVHPGETPGSFAINGTIQFILSDDPRAAELRRRFVFKVCPMLNPDGVAWGHSRFNTLGYDLNRCYRSPVPQQHEGVFAVKMLLLHWAARRQLLFYMDCHGHMNKRGCFLFGNHYGDKYWSNEDALLWNLAYAHAAQLNSPHLDINNCEWSKHFNKPGAGKKGGDGDEFRDGDDEADEKSRAESGRAQIGECCRLYHAYTLECNYNSGRSERPITDAPGLAPEAQAVQALQGCVYEGRRIVSVPYGPREWSAVGEALAVALLDLHCQSSHSRLLVARPPKPLLPPSRDLAYANHLLDRLFDALQARHAGKPAKEAEGKEPPEEPGVEPLVEPGLRRRLFKVVHSPHVYLRSKPDKGGSALGTRKPGEKVAILEVRGDGWVRLCPSEVAKVMRKGVTEAYMLVDGSALGLSTLLCDSGESIVVPDTAAAEGGVPAQLAPSIEDVEQGMYPPQPQVGQQPLAEGKG